MLYQNNPIEVHGLPFINKKPIHIPSLERPIPLKGGLGKD
jgi:hypothetical protein